MVGLRGKFGKIRGTEGGHIYHVGIIVGHGEVSPCRDRGNGGDVEDAWLFLYPEKRSDF